MESQSLSYPCGSGSCDWPSQYCDPPTQSCQSCRDLCSQIKENQEENILYTCKNKCVDYFKSHHLPMKATTTLTTPTPYNGSLVIISAALGTALVLLVLVFIAPRLRKNKTIRGIIFRQKNKQDDNINQNAPIGVGHDACQAERGNAINDQNNGQGRNVLMAESEISDETNRRKNKKQAKRGIEQSMEMTEFSREEARNNEGFRIRNTTVTTHEEEPLLRGITVATTTDALVHQVDPHQTTVKAMIHQPDTGGNHEGQATRSKQNSGVQQDIFTEANYPNGDTTARRNVKDVTDNQLSSGYMTDRGRMIEHPIEVNEPIH